jgi:hypothetical protein
MQRVVEKGEPIPAQDAASAQMRIISFVPSSASKTVEPASRVRLSPPVRGLSATALSGPGLASDAMLESKVVFTASD